MNEFSRVFAEVPRNLVTKVNGDATEGGFKYIGSCIAGGIEESLRVAGVKPLGSDQQILDFGSGLGRVILHLLSRAPEAEITGFDIDPMMLHWAARLIPDARARFVSSTLDINSGRFDLITVVSVFTHLDATTEFWLSEVRRLLSPSGRAFITYQDDTLFYEMQGKGQIPSAATLDGKYVTGRGSAEGGAAMGTFYSTPYWKALLEKFFKVETILPRGLFGHQSITVVTRREEPINRASLILEYAAALERDIFSLRRDFGIQY